MKKLILLITVVILNLTTESQVATNQNKTYVSRYNSDTLYCFEGKIIKAIEIDLTYCDYNDSIISNLKEKNVFLDSIIKNKDYQIEQKNIMFDNCMSINRADSIQAIVLKDEIKRLNKREKKIKIISLLIITLTIIFI